MLRLFPDVRIGLPDHLLAEVDSDEVVLEDIVIESYLLTFSTQPLRSQQHRSRRQSTDRGEADAWKLLAEHHVEDTRAADLSLHQNHARVCFDDFADDGGVLAQAMSPHPFQHGVGHLGVQLVTGDTKVVNRVTCA
jgi:hypothetical protein